MPKTIPIIIPEGTEIFHCITYSNGTPEKCQDNTKTSYLNKGELQLQPGTKTALFKSPSFEDCNQPPQLLSCISEFTLPEKSLNTLKANNPELAVLVSPNSAKSSASQVSPPKPGVPPPPLVKPTPASLFQNVPGFILPLFFVGLSVVVLTVLRRPVISLFIGNTRSQRGIKQPKYPPPIPNLHSKHDSSAITTSKSFNALKVEVNMLTAELRVNTSRLHGLEDDLIILSQRLQVIEGKSLSPRLDNALPSSSSFSASEITVQPQSPLSVDLIKKAVISVNYPLISTYPHFFLSETAESRQGLEDVKRFLIEGDQSHASSRTQSEFIAITCDAETYLIPNILPNAADPARTLKRHADRNNIYRNGQGPNLLNLVQLAVVEKNGDCFVLIKPGQIA